MITIDENTGIITWEGDLKISTTYQLTIKITNSDGGFAETTFDLKVINNG